MIIPLGEFGKLPAGVFKSWSQFFKGDHKRTCPFIDFILHHISLVNHRKINPNEVFGECTVQYMDIVFTRPPFALLKTIFFEPM